MVTCTCNSIAGEADTHDQAARPTPISLGQEKLSQEASWVFTEEQ